jgi:hypothetical protein
MVGNLQWIMTVIYHDAELLRAWLEHYAALGVPKFLIGVVQESLVEQVRKSCRDFNAHICHRPGDVWNIDTKAAIEESIRREHQVSKDDFCIYADLDEFQEYPRHLSEIIEQMNVKGYQMIGARFQDRLAADGSLAPYDPTRDLGEQYPLGTQLTRFLDEEDHKIILQRGSVRLQATGHHLPLSGKAPKTWPVSTKDRYIVHHFRWRAGLIQWIEQRLNRLPKWDRYERALNKLKQMIVANNGKIQLDLPIIDPIHYGKLKHPTPVVADPRVPATMKAPADGRGVWRDVIIQIKITNVCDLSCNNCSAGVGLTAKANRFFMTPDQFRIACRSLQGFRGLIGLFGGNPTVHKQFPEICRIFREEIPCRDQRGLWTNRVFDHGALCRETFGQYQNINLHGSQRALDEIKASWPEARILDGSMGESKHAPIAIAMSDLVPDLNERMKLIGNCTINQRWSAALTVVAGQLRGYFCEIAATFAEMYGDPSRGVEPVPGWAMQHMEAFADQVETYCHGCGIPLNGRKVVDSDKDAHTDVSQRHVQVAQLGVSRLNLIKDRAEIDGGDIAIRYLPQIS